MRATIIAVLTFACGMIAHEMMTSQPTDGYETILCKKIDQRGDTIVVENTMVKIK